MLVDLAQWLVDNILEMGYMGIFLLMMIESSFIPFPSELVLIPAGYLAQQGEMNVFLIFLASLAGSIVGAFINYFLAYFVGRELLMRYGKYIFISNSAMEKMERFFNAHGPISTFTGRLIPGIRQLISLPAGISRMALMPFTLYTALGAGIWSIVLITLGYVLGEKKDLIAGYLHQITLLMLAAIIIMVTVYIVRIKTKKN
jgi:membrane protein DedA with SNARE-associated domain